MLLDFRLAHKQAQGEDLIQLVYLYQLPRLFWQRRNTYSISSKVTSPKPKSCT